MSDIEQLLQLIDTLSDDLSDIQRVLQNDPNQLTKKKKKLLIMDLQRARNFLRAVIDSPT